jgi:hypothetical protein
MTTKIILVVVAVTTAAMLSMVAGQVSTQVVYGAKEKCTTLENEVGSTLSRCLTQGRDPTSGVEACDSESNCFSDSFDTTHRDAAEAKTDGQRECKEVNDNEEDGATCTKE